MNSFTNSPSMSSKTFVLLIFLLTIPSVFSIQTSKPTIRELAGISSSPPTSYVSPPPQQITASPPSIREIPFSSPSISINEALAPTATTTSSLDPKQIMALQSLGVSITIDPCSPEVPGNATVCDAGKPFRHLISLQLRNCSSDIIMSSTAMKAIHTLQSLAFIDCPTDPIRLPDDLAANLRSFTCVNSLHRLTGVWLSRMENLTDLTVDGVQINASGPSIILSKMTNLRSIKIASANLSGFLPKTWQPGITEMDFSSNNLKGSIPSSITQLSGLKHLDLSSNKLSGSIPSTIGDLLMLRNLSFAHNSLDGSVPDSLAGLSSLIHLDLSGNQFNGSVPGFISEMKSLTYLNLENNNFQGIVPFNASFIKKLIVFKIGGNANLCYNSSAVPSKLKLGIVPCDKNGLPTSTPDPSSASPAVSPSDDSTSESANGSQGSLHHGPSTVVLVVAIGLSTIIFLIIFCILLLRWCS